MIRSLLLYTLPLFFAAMTPSLCSAEERIVAYVPNWIDLPTFAAKIDYTQVTHLNLAFENPTNAEGDLSFDPKDEALLAAGRAHHVPVLLSIGGGSASDDKPMLKRYARLLAEPQRARFVAKIVAYLEAHGFAGLDVDLEGPAVGPDYGAFIADLSHALKPKGLLLTSALSEGYGGTKVPDSVFAQFDFVNIMAYDATGPWAKNSPGPHSSMEFAESSLKYWLDRGLPKDKAVLGVPFFGWGFGPDFRESGYPYSRIVATHPGAENSDQTGQTIYYNGLPTIRAKAALVKARGLGGMMIWSLDNDAAGERSLLRAMVETLRGK